MKSMIKNMKMIKAVKIIIVVLLLSAFAFSFVSCKLVEAIGRIELVKGSGNVISEDRDISGFSKISISGSGNLYIEQGSSESLTIEAEDNIIPLIITELSGDTLIIKLKNRIRLTNYEEINYYLTLKDLGAVNKSGSVNISCPSLETDSLTIKSSGSGSFEILGLDANDLNIRSSGSGKYIFTGTVGSQEIDISGSGNYDGSGLVSEDCTIKSSGSAEVTVNVTGSLDIEISGSGNIQYIGNPNINSNISGSSKIINISE